MFASRNPSPFDGCGERLRQPFGAAGSTEPETIVFGAVQTCLDDEEMGVDRSYIRVKAMLVIPSTDGSCHLVSVNAPTIENPSGFHRLIGGSVELGETHREAIVREVNEELGARIVDLKHLGMVENIFRFNGEVGHEIVALYSGTLDPVPAEEGRTLTESDGSIVPVVWRPFDDTGLAMPLYPAGVDDWIRSSLE